MGKVTGPNYAAKKRLLLKALEGEGEGVLVHPTHGRVVVFAKPYTMVEDLTGVGVAVFEMNFSVGSENIYPTNRGLFKFPDLTLNLNLSISDWLQFDFLDTFADTLLAAGNLLDDVYTAFDDVTRLSAGLSENLSTLKRTISDAKANIPSSLRDVEKIYDSFNDTFIGLGDLFDDPKDTVDLIQNSIFGLKKGRDTIEPTTVVRETEISNTDLINQSVNTMALSYAYLNAIQIDFENDQDLITLFDALDVQFLSLIDVIDPTVAANLSLLRDEFARFTDNLLVTIDKITTVETKPMSLLALAYQYYGSGDKYQNLVDLNKTLNPAEVSGEVKVLTV